MARQARFVLPGHPQHVIQRGNNRDITFVADEDYYFYLEVLSEACEKFDCSVHAYVLMTNHVHLLISPNTENGISKVMQSVGRRYVQYFNFCYRRTGTLWEGRYKATLLDTEKYLLTCYRYIELNPVRAFMVNDPVDYQWSSYRHNALGEVSHLIDHHEIYLNLGLSAEQRQSSYRALFNNTISESNLKDIRDSANKAWVLGDSKFSKRISDLLERRASPKKRGGDRKSKIAKINRV